MSILAAAATTNPSGDEILTRGAVFFQLGLLTIALGVASVVGVFRRRSVNGPVRVAADQPAWPLIVITVLGGATWLLSQIGYGAVAAAAFKQSHPTETFDIDKLSGGDFAFLSTVPAAVAFTILALGDVFSRRQLLDRIGFTASRFVSGALKGLLAIVIVWPLVNCGAGLLLELFYRAIHYEHPHAHELLGAMKDAEPWVRAVLVFGACVAAPVFEEFLFRGHIQTLLVRLFNDRGSRARVPSHFPMAGEMPPPFKGPAPLPSMSSMPPPPLTFDVVQPPPPPPTFDVVQSETPPPLPVLPVAPESAAAVLEYAPRPQRFVWVAILITSLIFASVHPLWMAPLIFVLSLCLGYAYERTGNLWVPIVIHALFNTSSTLLFLK